jgi:hypothetical protein
MRSTRRRVLRGLSTLTVDRPTRRLRLEVGDTVAKATPLGSAPIVAGVSFGRNYTLDRIYYRYPTPFIRGTTPRLPTCRSTSAGR